MRRNFIQDYERNIVDPAVNSAIKYMIDKAVNEAVMTLIKVIKENDEKLGYMIENNSSIRDEILQKTGVDIWQ